MFAMEVLSFFSCSYVAVCLIFITLAIFLFQEQRVSYLDMFVMIVNTSSKPAEIVPTCREKLIRPVGPLEKGLLLTEEKRRGANIITLIGLTSKIQLHPEMVRQALILLAKRYPLLRMKLVKESKNGEPIREYFTEVEDPSEINFKVLKDYSPDDLESVFERESEISLDFKLGPLWRAILLKEIHAVEEDTHKNAIVFTFHHVITDGRSVAAMLEQLLCYLTLLYEGQEILVESMPFRPSTANLMLHCCTPSALDKVVFSLTAGISRFRAFLFNPPRPDNLYLASYPPVFTCDSPAPNKTSIVYREFSPDETMSLTKTCKKLKCSVHGAITAASHIAMAKILQKGNEKAPNGPLLIKASCNVDLRKECRPEIKSNEFVLCVSSLRTEISVYPFIEDFWKFAQECMQKIKWSFFAGQHHRFLKQCHMILAAVEQQGTVPPSQQDLRVFNLSNMGKYQWSMEHKGPYRLDRIVASVTLQPTGPVFALLCSTINGTLYWTNSYNMQVVSREQAIEFLDLTLEILKDACSA